MQEKQISILTDSLILMIESKTVKVETLERQLQQKLEIINTLEAKLREAVNLYNESVRGLE